MHYGATPLPGAVVLSECALHPYPPISPPAKADITLNGAPWQLWRVLREPLVPGPSTEFKGPNPVVKNLPVGSVVDIVVQNELDGDVEEAKRDGVVNMVDPPMGFFHELPPKGSLAIRWRIEQPAMTMFHVFNAKQFVMGMQVPMFEGDDRWPEVPESVRARPHVEFKMPERMGIFD
ncbi:multicopper oxidase [Diplodia corticola]|uniref:Multicopper oxidase n=1 Tax=Diplodia corticola TaxID=236234 RepID=A0A1J9RR85_9PEZI|nr:multicopper oxidase [Diplodia corticola]OJD30412.1 multicopper oxidase [Diplodia corticola]